jgi:hypothetical protein
MVAGSKRITVSVVVALLRPRDEDRTPNVKAPAWASERGNRPATLPCPVATSIRWTSVTCWLACSPPKSQIDPPLNATAG